QCLTVLRLRPCPRAPARCPYTTLFRSQSGGLQLEARLTGRTRVAIVVLQDEEPLLVDTLDIASGSTRAKAVEGLPEQVRDEGARSEEHTSELQSHLNLVCRLLLEKQNT